MRGGRRAQSVGCVSVAVRPFEPSEKSCSCRGIVGGETLLDRDRCVRANQASTRVEPGVGNPWWLWTMGCTVCPRSHERGDAVVVGPGQEPGVRVRIHVKSTGVALRGAGLDRPHRAKLL